LINIEKQQKPILWIDLAQTSNLYFAKVHYLKSGLIKPLGPRYESSGLG